MTDEYVVKPVLPVATAANSGLFKKFVGEMDGSMIPVVLVDEDAEGDKRKTGKNEWQEAKLCQVYKFGNIDKPKFSS